LRERLREKDDVKETKASLNVNLPLPSKHKPAYAQSYSFKDLANLNPLSISLCQFPWSPRKYLTELVKRANMLINLKIG